MNSKNRVHASPINSEQGKVLAGTLALTAAIAMIDMFTGDDVGFFIFYIPPVILALWYGNLLTGIITAAVGIILWIPANFLFPHPVNYPRPVFIAWQVFEKTISIGVIVYMINRQKELTVKQEGLLSLDIITGLRNRRSFVAELHRYTDPFSVPFSTAMIEIRALDSYYSRFGQQAVDNLLKEIARVVKNHYADFFRFEENRFVVIFDETSGPTALRKMVDLREELYQRVMNPKKIRLIMNIGIVLCLTPGFGQTVVLRNLYGIMQKLHSVSDRDIDFIVLDQHEKKLS